MSEQEEQEKFVRIPMSRLSNDALEGVIDNYVLREGTDYGHGEISIAEKRSRIYGQLQRGLIELVFCTTTESCTLMTKESLAKKGSDVST